MREIIIRTNTQVLSCHTFKRSVLAISDINADPKDITLLAYGAIPAEPTKIGKQTAKVSLASIHEPRA